MGSTEARNKKIPTGLPNFVTEVSKKTSSLLWEIENAVQIKELNLWDIVSCDLTMGDISCNLFLLADSINLYLKPILVTPPQTTSPVFTIQVSLMDAKLNLIDSKSGMKGTFGGQSKVNRKMVLTKLRDLNVDYVAPLVADGNLRMFVEVAVFYVENEENKSQN